MLACQMGSIKLCPRISCFFFFLCVIAGIIENFVPETTDPTLVGHLISLLRIKDFENWVN